MSNLDISRAQRLDHYVIDVLPQLSRGAAAKLITDGKVRVNGQTASKAGYKLRRGDHIDIDFNNDDYARAPDIEIPIIYEDQDCLVLNKPPGLLTHSKGAFNPEPTIASFLRQNLLHHKTTHLEDSPLNSEKDGVVGLRAGIVHRLDRATSGVIVCAKMPEAMTWLQRQFSRRKVHKSYTAIVQGHLKAKHAVVDMPIERDPKKPQTYRAGASGKPAQTEYRVVQETKNYSLLELKPKTGRTHQLRVHCQQLGHPIVGDEWYGGASAERLYLHATSLEITLPNRQRQSFSADVPASFATLLAGDS
jgi:23S rRNA pseudouridine1911/1915/1917 synthase